MDGYNNDAVLRDWEEKWLDPDYDWFGDYEKEEDDDYLDFLFDVYEGEELEANQ